MTRLVKILAAGLLLLLPASLLAADKPDMTKQKTWSEKEKDAFYEWLKTQQGGAAGPGESRPVQTQTFEEMQQVPGTLSNKYFSSRAVAYNLIGFRHHVPNFDEVDVESLVDDIAVDVAGDLIDSEESLVPGGEIDASLIGIELQYGKPIKTWFRQLYNLGYYKGSVDWKLPEEAPLDASYSLFRAGYHLELALVPLGLDQTRNIVLRTGLDMLYGRKGDLEPVEEGDLDGQRHLNLQETMLDQVTGWQAGLSWSLGYEWQLGENFWRVYSMLDGFKAFHLSRDDDRQDYATIGLGIGISRVF